MSVRRTERAPEVFSEEAMRSAEEEAFEEMLMEAAPPTAVSRNLRPSKQQIVPKIPEAVDDFLRNVLQRAGLGRTMISFEEEWYGSAQKLMTQTLRRAGVLLVPDALTHRQLIQAQLDNVHRDTDLLRQEVLHAGERLLRTQRERDFYRLQYQRVAEHKSRLMEDLHQLKKHLQSYRPALRRLEDTIQEALRKKMLLSLKKDRVQNSKALNQDTEAPHSEDTRAPHSEDTRAPHSEDTRAPHSEDTRVPTCSRGPETEHETMETPLSLSYSIRAHKLPISCIHLHPRKLIVASASDDRSWRLWLLQAHGEKVGQMVLTGEGHSDWLSGCSFHPDGGKLATTSGDSTVRLWDFSRGGGCVLTLSHSRPTWGCCFHSCGHFLASCYADRTARLWDLSSQRCTLTLRRHTASVNSVCFLPFSDLLLTCSADKTLALWDARLGVCTAIFQGHQHPCNHSTCSMAGHTVASCDSCGIINLWDIRKPAVSMATVDAGPRAANQVAFSPSGRTLAVACSDGLVRVVEVDSLVSSSLPGHMDSVQSVAFDHRGGTVLSAGSDGLINVWA
ncbi:sperm-associated antigen 16 protein [Trematomus bernacchii]|uniref:sperm-associated antigen 16 protein n=1 Tax=Trematomus bernacchii TaxID=40690 RepID=UPI00146E9481|nr:sperm-associated antigen 16 protein [Trematomus bernacchii]